MMYRILACCAISWCSPALQAQPGGIAAPVVLARQPVVDPAMELKGSALVNELRRGGYVFYMRHAPNGPGDNSVSPCPGDSPLTAEGVSQARFVGSAIRTLGIRIGSVFTSATCRTRMTGELVAGTDVLVSTDLNPSNPADPRDWIAVRRALLNRPPAPGTNTLLVSHFHAAPDPLDRLFLDMTEIIVFATKSSGRPVPVARIPHNTWAELIQTETPPR